MTKQPVTTRPADPLTLTLVEADRRFDRPSALGSLVARRRNCRGRWIERRDSGSSCPWSGL